MSEYPKYIVDPLGQLHSINISKVPEVNNTEVSELPTISYNLVEDAPILQRRWLSEQSYTLTDDGELYNLDNHNVITFDNRPTLKFKKIIVKSGGELYRYPLIHMGVGLMLIDEDDNLWSCCWIDNEDRTLILILDKIVAMEVIAASIIHHHLIYYSRSTGWYYSYIESRRYDPPEVKYEVPPELNNYTITESFKLMSNYVIAGTGLYQLVGKRIVKTELYQLISKRIVKHSLEVIDVITVHINNRLQQSLSIAIGVDGIIYEKNNDDPWVRIRNPLLLINTPWVRLVPLNECKIGIINANGEIFSINNGNITQLQIPIELIRDVRLSKNPRML